MTTSSSKVSPDDVCALCGRTRENHGDAVHKFSEDGQLTAKEPPPEPRNTPPQPRQAGVEQQVLASDPVARTHLRMIERLTQKGILNGEDLAYIFGAGNAAS